MQSTPDPHPSPVSEGHRSGILARIVSKWRSRPRRGRGESARQDDQPRTITETEFMDFVREASIPKVKRGKVFTR